MLILMSSLNSFWDGVSLASRPFGRRVGRRSFLTGCERLPLDQRVEHQQATTHHIGSWMAVAAAAPKPRQVGHPQIGFGHGEC